MPLTLNPKAEPESLQQRLGRLLVRFRVVMVLRQGSQIVALLLACIAFFAWLDYRYRLAALPRAFFLTSLLVGIAILIYRWIIGPWRRERTLLAMAFRVERHFPELNDALLSALQFLDQPVDKQSGSAFMRGEAIRDAINSSEELDYDDAVPSTGLKRSLFVTVLVLIGGIWLFDRAGTAGEQAVGRLLVPFGAEQWPAKTTIELLLPRTLPHRMIRGESFEVQVRLKGVIPERVQFSIWPEGGKASDQVYTIAKGELTGGDAVLTIHPEANKIDRSFRFRVKANDADTGWQNVDVFTAPEFVPRAGRPSAQIHLVYPTYTDLLETDLPDGSTIIEAVTGTKVIIRAAADRPLVNARMVCVPTPANLPVFSPLNLLAAQTPFEAIASVALAHEFWQAPAVQLSSDGYLIDLEFVPHFSGSYILQMEDEKGTVSNRAFDIRVFPDPAPKVDLALPSASRETLERSADAEFTLVALVQDKIYAIRHSFLEYRTAPDQNYRRIDYLDGPTLSVVVPTVSQFMPMPLRLPGTPFPKLQTYPLGTRLPVQRFTHPDGLALKEGDTLTLRVGAVDYDDVTYGKRPGYSDPIDLQIVPKTQIDAGLQLALTKLREDLLLLRELQQEAQLKLREILAQVGPTGLSRDQQERLELMERVQQQVQAKILAPNTGLLDRAARLRQSILDNQLQRSTTTQRIEATTADLMRLAKDELGPLEQKLEAIRKPTGAPIKPALQRAERHQQEIEDTIRNLLERLEPWSGAGEIRGEARSILGELRQQFDMLQQLQKNQSPMQTGQKSGDLPKAVQEELERAATRPDRLAERVRQLIEKMERLADDKEKALLEKREQAAAKQTQAKAMEAEANKQEKGSPAEKSLLARAAKLLDESRSDDEAIKSLATEAEALRNAIKQANDSTLRKQIKDVPGRIRDNQLGDARTGAEAAGKQLEKMIKALEEPGKSTDIDLLRKRTKEADAELNKVIGEQELLQKKIEAAGAISDPAKRAEELKKLAGEQERLERESLELAKKLGRADNEPAAEELRRAARKMEDTRRQLEQGLVPQESPDAVLDRLDDAHDKIQRDDSEDELIREKLAKMTDLLQGLRDRQAAANDERKRLHAKVLQDRKWNVAPAKSLPGLIDTQTGLAKETRALIDKRFDSIPVFARMLKQSADAMDQSVKRLNSRKEDVLDQLEGIAVFDVDLEVQTEQGVRAMQDLALKRLDQLLESLKPDPEMFRPKKGGGDQNPMNPMKAGKGDGDALPPLAQLKAVRALQADVAERTTAFDLAHPDRNKLNENELAELDTLMKAQIDVAELIQELTPASKEDQP